MEVYPGASLVSSESQLPLGRLYLDLQNALDERYPDILGVDAAGRSLLVGLEWTGSR